MKTNIASSYRLIKHLNSLTSNEIIQWQEAKLRSLINHAYHNTQYYHKVFDDNNIKPEDIKSTNDLEKIPILTKSEIRENFEKMIPLNIEKIPHKKSSTGGSTGDPMPYLLDNISWSFSNASYMINWEKTGYNYGDKYIALGSTSLFIDKNTSLKHKFYYKLKNKIGLNGVNMSGDVCIKYVDLIKKKKIKFLYGYASAIYLLAKWSVENNVKINIKSCFTTSEVLTSQYRKTIEDAFQCIIVDCYGANDGGISAFAHKEGFYEVSYNSIVRIENLSRIGRGPALLTDLLNYAMPLINYKLGDELLIDDELNAQYSYNGQIINRIMGRTSDILPLSNGNILTGPGFTILFKDIPVDYYCIEKISSDSIICWIIKLPEFNASHKKIVFQTLEKQAGKDIHIEIKTTDKPYLSKSGKRLYMFDSSSS